MNQYRFPLDGDIVHDLSQTYGYSGDLARVFSETQQGLVNKWHHYLPLYDRYLAPRRGTAFRMLEIGVSHGGSLSMWRRWLGPEATIFGIDINPRCARYDGINGQVRIGSQDDPEFLNRVVDEMGGVDVVLDDGSHVMEHVRASFEILFPRLSVGGLYMIEDLHTAYLPRFGGGLDAPANVFRFASELVDDMHRWYHAAAPHHPDHAQWITGVHAHDSILVIDKQQVQRPRYSKVGRAR
jgi:Methyltransferase domain